MRDAQNRTFAALRTWPHEGTRLALQFAEEYEDGRRSVLLRETTFSRAATRLEHDIFRRARRVANAATSTNLDLIISIEAQLRQIDRRASELDLEMSTLQRRDRARIFDLN